MKILVTGGAGFIGSNLSDHLLKKGDEVICLDNFDDFYDPAVKKSNLKISETYPEFTLIEGDIRDSNLLDSLFLKYKPDTVVHLAARAGVRPSISNPGIYFDVNVTGTLALLESMKKHRCTRLVFGSSSSVYGNNKKIPFCESDNVDFPISPYAASKKACELLCHTYHHLHGFDIFCLRFFTVYGPRQRPEMAIHFFTRSLFDQVPITVFGDGNSERDYTYISDIIEGISRAILLLDGFEIFNLGESQTISLTGLITELETHTGMRAIINRLPMQPGDVETTFADIGKARKTLDYNPSYPVSRGIAEFVTWYKENIILKNN
jgi:UDP-glucuronate 4-epimerase